jgi:hypothetical protein
MFMVYDAEGGMATMSQEEMMARGNMLFADLLHPTATATTVRVREGKRLMTDGPFAETKEQLGGVYVFECKDLDEAIEIAAKIPTARTGSIEIRPVFTGEEMSS